MISERKPQPLIIPAGEGKPLDVMGVVFAYKATGTETGGLYAFTEGIVPPHRGAPLHIHHREDEAFYILEGEFEIECDGKTYQATPGTFAFLPRNVPHRFQNLTDRLGKVLCIQSPAGVEAFFEHLSLLTKDGLPDPEQARELARKYEIEFFLPLGG